MIPTTNMGMPIWLNWLLCHSICLQKHVCVQKHMLFPPTFWKNLSLSWRYLIEVRKLKGNLGVCLFLLFLQYLYLKTQLEYMVHNRKPRLTEKGMWRSVLLAQMTAFHFCHEIFKFQNNICYSHSLRHKINIWILVPLRFFFFLEHFLT